MPHARLQPDVVRTLTKLSRASDRTSPTVFAGREDEISFLNEAVQATCQGEVGHTVVIQGVPGAGKTALLHEYAARLLLTAEQTDRPIIPVPLKSKHLNAPPLAIIREMNRWFCEYESSDKWSKMWNATANAASLAGNVLQSIFTRKDASTFLPSSKLPTSLEDALDDYFKIHFARQSGTVVLLVDEAQNLADTIQVREHLESLHCGVAGDTQVMLVCFGLANTTSRLRELGLSRLAHGHVKSIGVLSSDDAKKAITGTLGVAFAPHEFQHGPFDEERRAQWIGDAADVILAESGNFPHHITNGCRALAEIVLNEGIDENPPVEPLKSLCRDYKSEYYDTRLQPWERHKTALALAFASGNAESGWIPVGNIKRALMASDEVGDSVDAQKASAVIDEMCTCGYVELNMGECRPVLPSLTSHFIAIERTAKPHSEVVMAVQAALDHRSSGHHQHLTR